MFKFALYYNIFFLHCYIGKKYIFFFTNESKLIKQNKNLVELFKFFIYLLNDESFDYSSYI